MDMATVPAPSANPYVFTSTDHAHLTPYLAALQASCVTHDRLSSSFLPPLNHEKLLSWWKDRIAECNAGTRLILLLLAESQPGTRAKGPELVGVVMLGMPVSETGPFRAVVEELLISPRYRRRGGARTLMGAVEVEAARRGKTLLVSTACPLSTPVKPFPPREKAPNFRRC